MVKLSDSLYYVTGQCAEGIALISKAYSSEGFHAAVCALENRLEAAEEQLAIRSRYDHLEQLVADRPALIAELEHVKGERDAEIVRHTAERRGWVEFHDSIHAERDALAAKLAKVQEWAETEGSLSTADHNNLYQILDSSIPSGTPPKTEQSVAHPRAATPVSGSSASQSERQNLSPEPTKSIVSAQECTPSAQESGDLRKNEAVPFSITGPGFYRQRDGGKAEVLQIGVAGLWPVLGTNSAADNTVWQRDGHYNYCSPGIVQILHEHDLVSLWVEPAAPAPAPVEKFEVVEREVVLWRSIADGHPLKVTAAEMYMGGNEKEVARATATFRIPRPKAVKPKVTASVTPHGATTVEINVSQDEGVAVRQVIDRSQAIALRDALNAAKLDGEGKEE